MTKIVQISEAASIGIHAMVIIARAKEQINANEIAELTGSSRNHIAKVMQWLVKRDFVKSCRGPKGGFVLKKAPEEINLLEIYECIDGDIEIAGCPMDRKICPFNKCLMGGIVANVTIQLQDYFRNQTLADLL